MSAPKAVAAAAPEDANACRIELVVAIHTLASHFENALGARRDDTEAMRKAEGDIAHARKIAAKWNWNGHWRSSPEEKAGEPLPAQLTANPWFQQWRHVKTGGLYIELCRGRLEHDQTQVVVYRGEDGWTWVRPAAEFFDGRFVADGRSPTSHVPVATPKVAAAVEPVAWIDRADLEKTLPDDGWCVVHESRCDPGSDHAADLGLVTTEQLAAAISQALAQGRAQALEEAAKVCKARADGYKYATDIYAEEHASEALLCEAAIRSLTPPAQPEKEPKG